MVKCPASFRPVPENLDNMRAFFAAAERPAGVRMLWEPRGPWPDEVIREMCAALDLTHVVDPLVRATVTPGLVYWRLHGLQSAYRSYTEDELRRLVDMIPDGEVTYAMFNNIPRAADSKRFRAMLGKSGRGHVHSP